MNLFSIKYQTAEVVPAPFAHAIEIKGEIKLTKGELVCDFELTYLDRNTLTIEEILEEGFTENDDFSWKGTLPSIWNDVLLGNLKTDKHLIINELEETQEFWEIEFNAKTFYPKNVDGWKYLLEELQQAIMEKTQNEMPMKLTLLKINETQTSTAFLEASFLERKLKVSNLNDGGSSKSKFLAWEELNFYLKNIFSADFYPEKAATKLPTQQGIFLNTGDEYWYEFGKTLKGNYKKIEQFFGV